jgi:hypothetical protein
VVTEKRDDSVVDDVVANDVVVNDVVVYDVVVVVIGNDVVVVAECRVWSSGGGEDVACGTLFTPSTTC